MVVEAQRRVCGGKTSVRNHFRNGRVQYYRKRTVISFVRYSAFHKAIPARVVAHNVNVFVGEIIYYYLLQSDLTADSVAVGACVTVNNYRIVFFY